MSLAWLAWREPGWPGVSLAWLAWREPGWPGVACLALAWRGLPGVSRLPGLAWLGYRPIRPVQRGAVYLIP